MGQGFDNAGVDVPGDGDYVAGPGEVGECDLMQGAKGLPAETDGAVEEEGVVAMYFFTYREGVVDHNDYRINHRHLERNGRDDYFPGEVDRIVHCIDGNWCRLVMGQQEGLPVQDLVAPGVVDHAFDDQHGNQNEGKDDGDPDDGAAEFGEEGGDGVFEGHGGNGKLKMEN